MEGIFGRKERRWFEKSATGMRHGKFVGHAVCGGKPIAVLGTTVSREGLVFMSHSQLREPELQVSFTLRERRIPSRVRIDHEEALRNAERIVHRYFCTFSAIAADDWDAVVRYVDGTPEPAAAAPREPLADDDFRALPLDVQTKIVEHLVKAKRLAPSSPGTAPLIRLKTGSVREYAPGRSCRDVAIDSRVRVEDETRDYRTRFRVYSDGAVEPLIA